MAKILMQVLPVSERRASLPSNTPAAEVLLRITHCAFSDMADSGNSTRQSAAIPDNSNWTVVQVAQHAGISPRTVRHHIADGLLPAEKIGNSWAITAENAATYAAAHRRT